MTQPLLRRLAFFARRRYRWIFAAFGVLLLLSVFLVSRLSLDTDLLNLLPSNDETVDTFRSTMKTFGSIDYMLVVVRVPEGAVLAPYETFADRLAERLDALPQIGGVEYHLGETADLLDEFFPKAALFLDEDGRQRVEERLSDAAIRTRVAEMRRLLSTPQGSLAKQLLTLDPLGLADVFLGRLNESRGAIGVDWSSGYYVSQDHRMLLLLAKPVRPPQDVDFDDELVRAVEAEVAAAHQGWPGILGFDDQAAATAEGFAAAPEVDLGGSYLTALDDARFIVRDGVLGFATALAGVLILFLFAFRRLGPLLFAALPLAVGLLLAFGFAGLALGTLSTVTSGTAALLIGLGLDFVIVSYGRYVEERRGGASLEAALVAMSGSSGRAVVVGAVTTAATFYAFLITRFAGLREMGILTGTGILLCMLSVLFLLPALIAWREDRHRRRSTGPRLYLHGFGTRRLMGFAMAKPRTVMTVGALITLVAFVFSFRLEFQESTTTMRPAGNRGIEVSREVGQRFGSGFDYMMLVARGANEEQVIATAGRAADKAEEMVESGVLYRYSAITSLIPPPQRQAAVLDWLDREHDGVLDFARIESTFRAALADEGLRAAPFDRGLSLLRSALQPHAPITAVDLAKNPQTEKLLERYLQPDGEGGWLSVVYLYPPENLWRREAPPEALRGGGGARSGRRAHRHQPAQPAGAPGGAARRLGGRLPRPRPGRPAPLHRLPHPAPHAAGAGAAGGGDRLDAGRDGGDGDGAELHEHLRHHHDHRHRGGLRAARRPPLPRDLRPRCRGDAARPGGDRQRHRGGRAVDGGGLRLAGLLPLPRAALGRTGGDPRRRLHRPGGDHRAAGVPRLAAALTKSR